MTQSANVLGGALWINLSNTVRMQDKNAVDRLQDPRALEEWLVDNELPASVRELPYVQALPLLTGLRELCGAVLLDLERLGRPTEATMSRLRELSSGIAVDVSLVWDEAGKPDLAYDGASAADVLRYRVLRSIAETLRTIPPERIRKCEHEDCILRFADTSKSGKRRWCSMDSCGNRRKAADFYARRKQQRAER